MVMGSIEDRERGTSKGGSLIEGSVKVLKSKVMNFTQILSVAMIN